MQTDDKNQWEEDRTSASHKTKALAEVAHKLVETFFPGRSPGSVVRQIKNRDRGDNQGNGRDDDGKHGSKKTQKNTSQTHADEKRCLLGHQKDAVGGG